MIFGYKEKINTCFSYEKHIYVTIEIKLLGNKCETFIMCIQHQWNYIFLIHPIKCLKQVSGRGFFCVCNKF